MLFNHALFSSLWSALAVLVVAPSRYVTRDARFGRLEQQDDIFYSSVWSGAVLSRASGTFSHVTGTITIPSVSGNEGDGGWMWVGIDGHTCENAILASGVGFYITDGQPLYYAWYEWWPDEGEYYSGIDISVGDEVQLTVAAYTSTTGSVSVDNITNGQSVSRNVSSSHALCRQDADWIVQDDDSASQPIALADFATVTFTTTQAAGDSGSFTAAGATLFGLQEQNGVVVTAVSIDGSGDVTVTCG